MGCTPIPGFGPLRLGSRAADQGVHQPGFRCVLGLLRFMYLTFHGMWVSHVDVVNHGVQTFYSLNEGLCIQVGPEKVISTLRKLLRKIHL